MSVILGSSYNSGSILGPIPICIPRNGFKLSIVDNGTGMDRDTMLKMTAFCASTREIGKGKNFGIGSKVSAYPLNHTGYLI